MARESGVHCVQRLSGSGKNRRMHTSTVCVVVLRVVDQSDMVLDERDVKIETFRSSGRGGQHVNVTDSAVRLTHLPTGLVAQSQEERSQGANKRNAFAVLRARLSQLAKDERTKAISHERRMQMAGADLRNLRTYNEPQNRVTDHLTGATGRLDRTMRGDLEWKS